MFRNGSNPHKTPDNCRAPFICTNTRAPIYLLMDDINRMHMK
jgi:hypothetical protein